MRYFVKIGLEVHLELRTKTKMFCDCLNDPAEKTPDINICPVCLGHPGTLPVINREAVNKVIKAGLALNCQILECPRFDRKNYFYPDLPKNYQISQLYQPLCRNGFLEIGGNRIRIREIHLEEDTGRLIHSSEGDYSLVDFNRAGVPLMELVTEPDITSAKQAGEFSRELQLIFRYLDISDADMEKGQMRVEINLSLSKSQSDFGTKVEVKNLNSFRAVERAAEYEIKRQGKLLDEGKRVFQETRGWDPSKGITFSQREKEEAQDYRYFPEPDLPPLHITQDIIDRLKAEIPELPDKKRQRLQRQYGLSEEAVEVFVQNKDLGEYFENVMSELRRWIRDVEKKSKVEEKEFFELARLCSNYMITDLQGLLKGASVEDENFLISPENFAEFVTLIYKGTLSSKIAKTVLQEMFSKGLDPSCVIEEKGLALISSQSEIEKIVKEIISQNPKPVEDYKKGKENALQFLVGKVMAKTKGRADPKVTRETLLRILGSS